MKKYLLSHDFGTSGDKATLFSTEGELIKSCVASYEVNFFGENCAEQNPEDWWKAICNATKEVTEGVSPEEIVAISFSAQMQGCLVVDREGTPLRPSIIWADQRAVKQAAALEAAVGRDEIYHLTGHRVSPAYSIEKLMWIKEEEPEIYAKTYKMLQAKDYIIWKLTGKFVTDFSDASGTQALDLKNWCWADKILDAAGIEKEKLPILLKSTDIAGSVTKEAAKACGLSEGTMVVCGGGDGPCSAVGAGCVEDGKLFTTFGTSAWIGGTTKEPFVDEEKILFCFAHVIPGHYMPCGTMQAAGSSYSYIRHALCEGEPYDELNKRITQSPPGAGGLIFLPYLLGERCPRWNPKTTGAFLGIRPEHGKDDYVRAVVEGVAMNLDLILSAYRNYFTIEQMNLTGGGAKGAVVSQILADVMGVTLSRPNHVEEATAIGAAVIAGVGAGIFESFDEVKRFIKIESEVKPHQEVDEVYKKAKQRFDMSYKALLSVYEEW